MKKILWVMAALVVGWGFTAFANLEQQKLYKEAFPDAKPKCVTCHVDAIPKKDEGKHDWNAYGQAIKAKAGEGVKPTVDAYKAVGPAEKFQETK
jgi:hypothetical protein